MITGPEQQVIRLVPQPHFPVEDALPDNVPILDMMARDAGLPGQARFLQEHQRSLHYMAMQALRRWSVGGEDSPATYSGFTYGFAAMEAMTGLLRGRAYDTALAAHRVRTLLPADIFAVQTPMSELLTTGLHERSSYVSPTTRRELDLAIRNSAWEDRQPHTYGLLFGIMERRISHIQGLFAGLLGAQIAAELQDPTIPTPR
jgi:hypothetical protein